jgi:hypothetical protein
MNFLKNLQKIKNKAMTYSSRVYRQRNPKPQDESKESHFFSKQKQDQKGKKNTNLFFQAKTTVNEPGDSYEKEADSVANKVVYQGDSKSGVQKKEMTPIQRLATTSEEEKVSNNDERIERDKEKPFQRKPEEQEKEKVKSIQKKDDPLKEKDKAIQKKGDDEKKEKEIHKMDDPSKEREKDKSKEPTSNK